MMPVSFASCVVPFARAISPRAVAITDVSPSSSAALRCAAISSSNSRYLEASHFVAFFIFAPIVRISGSASSSS